MDAALPLPHPTEFFAPVAVSETAHWYSCGGPPGVGQGWKLYVSMTPLNARELVRVLVPQIIEARLHCKYVKDVRTLRQLNAGAYGYPQIGKNLVVYLPIPDLQFIASLKRSLHAYRYQCPAVPFARPFGNGLPLFYRYGSYDSATIVLDRTEVADNRSSLAVPDSVSDALAPCTTPEANDPCVEHFLRRYPIFGALVQQGKGGVFHAMDLESASLREVALKVGYHRGHVQADGSDGCDALRRELANYRVISDRGLAPLAPALVDSLDVPRKVILVLEYIDGVSLLHSKLGGTLTVEHLERAWAIIDEFHQAGIQLGDAKLANFLIGQSDELRVVDFETAGVFGERMPLSRTFFVSPEPDDPIIADQAHFLASVLYPYETASRSTFDARRFSLSDWLLKEAYDDLSAWALDRLARICRPT